MGPDFIRSGHRLVHCSTDNYPRLKYDRADDDLRRRRKCSAIASVARGGQREAVESGCLVD